MHSVSLRPPRTVCVCVCVSVLFVLLFVTLFYVRLMPNALSFSVSSTNCVCRRVNSVFGDTSFSFLFFTCYFVLFCFLMFRVLVMGFIPKAHNFSASSMNVGVLVLF